MGFPLRIEASYAARFALRPQDWPRNARRCVRVRSIKHQGDRTQENVPRREFNASKPGLEFSGRNVEVVAKRLLATQQLACAL
jgi:hypothetical protein